MARRGKPIDKPEEPEMEITTGDPDIKPADEQNVTDNSDIGVSTEPAPAAEVKVEPKLEVKATPAPVRAAEPVPIDPLFAVLPYLPVLKGIPAEAYVVMYNVESVADFLAHGNDIERRDMQTGIDAVPSRFAEYMATTKPKDRLAKAEELWKKYGKGAKKPF